MMVNGVRSPQDVKLDTLCQKTQKTFVHFATLDIFNTIENVCLLKRFVSLLDQQIMMVNSVKSLQDVKLDTRLLLVQQAFVLDVISVM